VHAGWILLSDSASRLLSPMHATHARRQALITSEQHTGAITGGFFNAANLLNVRRDEDQAGT